MLWNFLRAGSLPPIGELMRRAHSRWLTRAVQSGRPYPRIPVRPMSEGGFAPLLRRADGPRRAEAWWAAALGRVEDDPD